MRGLDSHFCMAHNICDFDIVILISSPSNEWSSYGCFQIDAKSYFFFFLVEKQYIKIPYSLC